MAKSEWTKEERQEMVALMAEIAATHHCEHCTVVPTESKYCDACIVEMTDWLHEVDMEHRAARDAEQHLADRGLY